jgi:hypothetical protein
MSTEARWAYTITRFDHPGANEGTIVSWHETLEEAEIAKIPRDREVGPHYEIIPRRAFEAVQPAA